jgi:hypothetical protein
MPADSAARARRTAFFRSRTAGVFSVTGTPCGAHAATTASTIASASGSSFISAEPAHWLHTFLAGQPMLMSMIWAPRATL